MVRKVQTLPSVKVPQPGVKTTVKFAVGALIKALIMAHEKSPWLHCNQGLILFTTIKTADLY
jgi:hypothetical protein